MATTRPHHDVDEKPQHDEGPTEKISCVECRRLKRKCDRIHPCNQCRRYDKTCVFPQPEVPRRGKRYLAQVKGRVERLERLLAQHAPHVDIEDEDSPEESKPGVGAMMVPTQTAAGFRSAVSSAVSHEPQYPPPPVPQTPLDIFAAPPNMMATEATTGSPGRHNRVTTVGANNVPSVSPASSLGMFSDNAGSGGVPRRPPPVAQPSTSRGQHLQGPQQPQFPSSTAEAYERQPRNASGYEWNERQSRIGENDGTASLSVEPDGEGYLGFASGATLLRILQMTAGGISLKGIPDAAEVEPPAPAHWQPSHSQLQLFIDSYFATYHTQYPIIHEHTFRAQVNEVVAQPPLKQWTVLYNTVLGLGAFCESQPMYVVDYFMERAISQISVDHLETGSLVLVQAFTLLSNLAQKRNKPNAGSTYLGIAVRMAIGLGLHRELPLWNIKPFDREVRRRVWWVVYIFDSGASITFGRPILLPYGEADVRIVHNAQDRHFTPHSPSVPPQSTEKTIYSALIWQSLFHNIGNGCYDRVIATPAPTAEEVLDLDRELSRYYTTVPEWMQARATPDMFPDTPWLYFSAHKLFWRYSNLRIILHRRAFLDRALKGLPMAGNTPGMELEHTLAATCIDSAMDTIYDIYGFFKARAPNRLETWYALHFLFQASFVPLIAMHTDPASPSRGSWADSVRMACETLHAFQGDPLASRCLRIIDLLMPSMTAPQVEVPTLLDFFSANPMFQGTAEVQDLLPFADLATLMSFWPQNQGA